MYEVRNYDLELKLTLSIAYVIMSDPYYINTLRCHVILVQTSILGDFVLLSAPIPQTHILHLLPSYQLHQTPQWPGQPTTSLSSNHTPLNGWLLKDKQI